MSEPRDPNCYCSSQVPTSDGVYTITLWLAWLPSLMAQLSPHPFTLEANIQGFKVSMDNITEHVSSIHLQKIAESYDHKSGVHQPTWKKMYNLKGIHTGLSEVYHHFPQV